MKKLLSLVLACMLICGVFVPGAFAKETKSLFTYKVLKDGTAEITGINDTSMVHLDIPAEIDGYPVSTIGFFSLADCTSLVSVTIPEGVKSLRGEVFANCFRLESVTIPDSLIAIEDGTLRSKRLTEVVVSPDHPVFAVENEALINRKEMKLVRFLAPEETGTYEIAQGIRDIASCAFEFSRVSAIVIPDSVVAIQSRAFTDSDNLQSVNIPDSVLTMGECIFDDCDALSTIEISPDHPKYECLDLCLVDKDRKEILSASGAIEGKYVIPEGVTAIGAGAFQGCRYLKELYIPNRVKDIGPYAFSTDTVIKTCKNSPAQEYCKFNERYRFTEMTKEEFAEAVKELEGKTEYKSPWSWDNWRETNGSHVSGPYRYSVNSDGTATITYVNEFIKDGNIPAELDGHKVTTIDNMAFFSCEGLKEVVIPEGVTSIGDCVFESCNQLETIRIPDSLNSINGQFISYCPNVKNIEISPDHPVLKIESNALINTRTGSMLCLLDRESTGTYTVPPEVRILDDGVFEDSKYSAIILPDGLKKIGSHAFISCASLKELVLPEGVTNIGSQAFYDCPLLETINIPDSVIYIEEGIFGSNPKLKTVQISPDHPAYEMIDHLLVEKRSKKLVMALNDTPAKFEIPEGIKEIGSLAFQGSGNLTELVIPEGVTSIGSSAFSGCFKLKKITLPASMKEIGFDVFIYSKHLVIKAPEGSWAEQYCKENGYEYEGMKNEE